MQRAAHRLTYVIPITLALIFVLLYLNSQSLAKVLIVLVAVPFSLVGAFLLLWLLGYHFGRPRPNPLVASELNRLRLKTRLPKPWTAAPNPNQIEMILRSPCA